MNDLLQVEKLSAEVAVPLPIEGIYSYAIPDEWRDTLQVGVRVLVPFKNREIIGYVVGRKEWKSEKPLKPILKVLDAQPVLTEGILQLTNWIASAYGSSWGEAIENALPKWVKHGKSAERSLKRAAVPVKSNLAPPQDLILSEDQTRCLELIFQSLKSPAPKPILIHGVTGSGKSEIYIRAIREVLRTGKSAICLVPEIALTEQIRRFFFQHFGDELEILHSKLTDAERFHAWKRIEDKEKRVVLGPRSAVFAPLANLGLIIIDEEHENTYKQETAPRYHAREVAAWRASNEKALLIMGSATPSLEAFYQSEKGIYARVDLKKRIDEKAMPHVQMIDLKDANAAQKRFTILTPRLCNEIGTNLQKKEGTILLLNRRGFSTHIHCTRCGYIESCQSCQVSLTFHQEDGKLLCHYCNFQKVAGDVCPQCKNPLLKFAGFGTEKVESEVAARFPTARIARMDADTVKKRGSHEIILKEFREQRVDILIGTQMIAKGFDFPHVTLVGVILADVGLMLPDFRSAERTFQLLTQVAGRAGRGKLPGRVIIQTLSPNHPSVRFAQTHDYDQFYRHEIRERYEYRYPPYSRLINVIIRSKNEKKAYLFAREFRDALNKTLELGEGVDLIGPAPLPFYKLRGHFRWHVMLKVSKDLDLVQDVKAYLFKMKKVTGVAFALDVDPQNIL